MSNQVVETDRFLSFKEIENYTFDEALAIIKERKTPKTWNEMEAEGTKGHIGAMRVYKDAAEKRGERLSYRGLYFFITKENDFLYIGRRDNNILNRLYKHGWDEEKKDVM